MDHHDDLIFDVGLHRAEDTRYYLAKGFRVVAVEASPELAGEVARLLHDDVESGRLTIINAAVAETSCPVTLYTNSTTEWNTTMSDWDDRNRALGSPSTGTVEVPGLPFADLIDRYGVPHYLKIDIEGADMLCLLGLRVPDVPRYVSIESNKVSWTDLRREFEVLQALGYRRFKVVPQQRMYSQVPPKPAKEGRYVNWRFEHMSSGMFGEEAPGRWLTAGQALLVYRYIFLRYGLFGDRGRYRGTHRGKGLQIMLRGPGWYDTHAAL